MYAVFTYNDGFKFGVYDSDSQGANLPDVKYGRLIEPPSIRAQALVSGNSEVTNITISLDNGDGEISTLLESSLLSAQCDIYKNEILVFSGRVQAVYFSESVRIEVET